jgi:hypothetical protein
MPAYDSELAQRRATYVTLTGTFLSLLAVFSLVERKRGKETPFKPFDLVMLGLASYRMGRLAAYDQVFETLRSPFTRTVPDAFGAGDTVEPKGTGARRALGELISCPICAGTWISAFLVYGLTILPGPTRTMLKIMSAMGLAELLNAASEAMQWTGEAARKRAGWREIS